MKIALVSTGLGRIVRGFESFSESLFLALRSWAPQADVTLFQGGGTPGDRRVVVRNFHRNDVPARWFNAYTAGLLEQRSYAVSLYPHLIRGRYQLVHYNELVMGSALFHLRRYFGGKFKLLYVNGAPSPPMHYHHRCDFAQVLTGPAYEEALEFGLPDERLFLIPYGVDARRFSPEVKSRREEIRNDLGIPKEAKVILTVAALKREHKRIDYVIREVSHCEGPVWFLAAGQRTNETGLLEEDAERLLQGRWRFVSWPHEKIHQLYGASDVFLLASLTEGLANVLLEAMASGLPVIIHKGPIFQWVAEGTSARLIDMSAEETGNSPKRGSAGKE